MSPLGATAGATWDALLAGRYIVDHSRTAGEFDRASPRVIQMVRRVVDEALAESGWSRGDEFATVVGTSKGSVESWLTPLQHSAGSPCETGGLENFGMLPAAFPDVAGLADIAAELRVGVGPRLTVSAACASGLLALIRGVMMIRAGEARRVLVVAAEASVHPLFLGCFKRLGVLPGGGIGCRPFDEAREGFLMSEAAAAVCLDAAPSDASRRVAPNRDRPARARVCSDSAPVRVAVDRFASGASHRRRVRSGRWQREPARRRRKPVPSLGALGPG